MNLDILLNKTDVIHRCLARIDEEYANNEDNLHNFTKQDSIILNLQRCCEASIDLAMHTVAELQTGIPQSSRDAFDLLYRNNIIAEDLSRRLKAMVGFRNIAVHDYQAVRLEILKAILDNHLVDFTTFTSILKEYANARP
ncbi:type VII toxin-antitoxin system HepT family RNase toxin [Paenibacillus sp. 1P07SE]|uniref:type VII toxin-antitoxin system HepT family RNase toxin n=1 Tax=Paenibacillus sp. 1P07SE TaxID=3132209 RepID=UPI0039A5D41E